MCADNLGSVGENSKRRETENGLSAILLCFTLFYSENENGLSVIVGLV